MTTEDLEMLRLNSGGQQPVSPGTVPGGDRTPGTPQAVSPGLQQAVAAGLGMQQPGSQIPVLPSPQQLGSGGLGVLQTGMGDLGLPVVLQVVQVGPGGQGVLPIGGGAVGPLLESGTAELLLGNGAAELLPSGLGDLEGLPLQEPELEVGAGQLEATELLPTLDGAWSRWVSAGGWGAGGSFSADPLFPPPLPLPSHRQRRAPGPQRPLPAAARGRGPAGHRFALHCRRRFPTAPHRRQRLPVTPPGPLV